MAKYVYIAACDEVGGDAGVYRAVASDPIDVAQKLMEAMFPDDGGLDAYDVATHAHGENLVIVGLFGRDKRFAVALASTEMKARALANDAIAE